LCLDDDDELSPSMTWRPKLTGYRILVLLLPNALTTTKAVLEYKGKRKESTSVDLAVAVGVAIM